MRNHDLLIKLNERMKAVQATCKRVDGTLEKFNQRLDCEDLAIKELQSNVKFQGDAISTHEVHHKERVKTLIASAAAIAAVIAAIVSVISKVAG